ncbi:hypothetical protein ACFE04_004713 [Oxalis oulophora]
MQTLTDTLCKELDKDELNLNSGVLSLSYSQDGKSALHNNWSISHVDVPLSNVKEMKITKNGILFSLDLIPQVQSVAIQLQGNSRVYSPITLYMPLSVKVTTFKKEKVKQPIKGFGVLVPSKEQQNGLKTLDSDLS